MATPTQGDVHVDAILTNISVAHVQEAGDFVADRVFPNVPVSKQSDKYFKYDIGDWSRDTFKKRADSTESAGGGWKLSTDTYFADVWALHKDIGEQVMANADAPLNMPRDAAIWLAQMALINKESEFVSNFFTTSIWTGSDTGSDLVGAGTTGELTQWNDADSQPIKDVKKQATSIKLKSRKRPNKLVVGAEVWEVLSEHNDILDRINQTSGNTNPAIVTRLAVAALFEVSEVLVMEGVETTSAESATFEGSTTPAFIGGKNALLVYANPTPSIMQPSGGYTFSWTGLVGSGAMGLRIKNFYMDEKSCDRIEAEMAYDMKVVDARCGAFFSSIVS